MTWQLFSFVLLAGGFGVSVGPSFLQLNTKSKTMKDKIKLSFKLFMNIP